MRTSYGEKRETEREGERVGERGVREISIERQTEPQRVRGTYRQNEWISKGKIIRKGFSHCSITVMKHHDQGSSHKRNHLIGGLA